jgi:hypothetical protein
VRPSTGVRVGPEKPENMLVRGRRWLRNIGGTRRLHR